jgi:hypothetical protein
VQNELDSIEGTVATKPLFAKRTQRSNARSLWRQSRISQNELDAIRGAVTALHHFAKRTRVDQAQGGGEVTFRKTNPRAGVAPVAEKSHFANGLGLSRAPVAVMHY